MVHKNDNIKIVYEFNIVVNYDDFAIGKFLLINKNIVLRKYYINSFKLILLC